MGALVHDPATVGIVPVLQKACLRNFGVVPSMSPLALVYVSDESGLNAGPARAREFLSRLVVGHELLPDRVGCALDVLVRGEFEKAVDVLIEHVRRA